MAIITRYFTQNGSFRSQLHQVHGNRTHTLGNRNVALGVQFLVTYELRDISGSLQDRRH